VGNEWGSALAALQDGRLAVGAQGANSAAGVAMILKFLDQATLAVDSNESAHPTFVQSDFSPYSVVSDARFGFVFTGRRPGR
jgi:hypothetical protein